MARKRESVDQFEELAVFTFPFRMTNFLLLAFYCLVCTYVATVWGFFGTSAVVPTAALIWVTSLFFFGYLFVVVDYTTQGYQHIPSLSKNLLDSEKPRIVKEIILVSVFLALLVIIDNLYWQLFVAIAGMVVFPLATSVVLMEERLLSAISPLKWVQVMRDVEADSVFYRFMIIECMLVLAVYMTLVLELGFIGIATVLYLVMILFRALGVVLHSNADRLGIPVRYSEQVQAAQEQEMADQEISEEASALYKLCAAGHTGKAFKQLNDRLEADQYRTEADFFAHLRTWERPQLAIRAGQNYIQRLVVRGQFDTALDVLEFCYNANGKKYRLLEADTVFQLSERAETLNHREIITHLLEFVPEDFPSYPRGGDALLAAARILAHDLNDFPAAHALLSRIDEDFPATTKNSTYVLLREIVSQ